MKNLGLGEILQLQGWITRPQLHRALALQRRKGGRLGSCLLEGGSITEDQLLSALTTQTGLPRAEPADLENIPSEALSLVPADLVRRRRAVPFRLRDNGLDVCVEDSGNVSAHDELAFASGKRVRFYVTPEVRVYGLLETYYGDTCPPRYAQLLRQVNQVRSGWRTTGEDSTGDESIGDESTGTHRPGPRRKIATGELWLASGAATRKPAFQTSPSPPAKKKDGSLELSESERQALFADRQVEINELPLEARLRRASTAQEVGEALMGHLASRFSRCALLKVESDGFRGWMCGGDDAQQDRFPTFQADLQHPSSFLSLYHGVGFFTGPLPPMEVHQRFLAYWNGRAPLDCAIVPVRVQKKLICLIYVDRLHPQIQPPAVADLRGIAAEAAKAFENCILRNRLRSERSRKTV